MTKLFCLPYAGGSSMFYSKWKPFLHPMIQLYPLEMSGRGTRFGACLHHSVEDVTDDFFNRIAKELDSCEYALFGHSMGTLIIYELMRKIMHAGYKNPKHIFFSGRFPPHIKEKRELHQLPDDLFKLEIIKLGGIPKDLIDEKEIFDIFLPILRADYTVLDTYQYKISEPWGFDISVLSGKEDNETLEYDYSEWERYTKHHCYFHEYEGDHFFIHNNTENIVKLINDVLVR